MAASTAHMIHSLLSRRSWAAWWTVIEAFKCFDFYPVQQLRGAGPGGPGEVVEGDESVKGQDDHQFRQVISPVAMHQVIEDREHAPGQLAGAFVFGCYSQERQPVQLWIVVDESGGLTLRVCQPGEG